MEIKNIRNGKVRCIGFKTAERYFTLNKVYEVKDGRITNDNGYRYTADFFGDLQRGWYTFELVVDEKIVITHDGKITTATMYREDGTKETATARCAPEDKFDFSVGAKLAMERLMEKVSSTEWRVVNREARVGDYIRLRTSGGFTFSKPGDILKVDRVIGYSVEVYGKNHPRDTCDPNYLWTYMQNEYEVVEKVTKEEPKYYNGKVVCVKTDTAHWTVGKIYEVKDGKVISDKGWEHPRFSCEPYKDVEDIRHIGSTPMEKNLRHNPKNEFIPIVE
jgi:hypothetical protein